MKDRLVQALKKSKADYADVRFEIADANAISYRGEEIETMNSSRFMGGIARACTKGGWGIATFDDAQKMPHAVEEACACAALVGREKTELAEVEIVDAVAPARLERDFRGVPLDDKLALIAKYNDLILKADPAIATSWVFFTDAFRTVHFASSRGAYFMEERPRVILSASAVARSGSLVQRTHHSVSSARTYDVVLGLEEEVEATAKRAVALLDAPPCEGGVHTVILDQKLAGVFAHEAFGHLSEADFLYENPKMRDLMHCGREMGAKGLNILDDGSAPDLLGSVVFDDEGTRTHKTHLIKDGVLVNHLHSLETAAKMGEPPTGNARAIDRTYPPIVRMTNTYIDPGQATFEDLIGSVDKGIYACDMQGGQTMMEMFTFSAAYGYRIENGKVADLIRDITLTGNVFETLHNIDGFANDFEVHQTGGGCGKGGQSPLPVTFGSPHIRIRNVVLGGT
ncbi:MAG: TldD/PmbA family protein [Planctomycetes bacterium]|nr:TldD/PmbA family protein [Planctomycetota bacterium]